MLTFKPRRVWLLGPCSYPLHYISLARNFWSSLKTLAMALSVVLGMGRERSHWQEALPHDGLSTCEPWWGQAAVGWGRSLGWCWRNSLGAVPSAGLRARLAGSHPGCLVSLLRPTLCNPMDCSPPGSSVHGSIQAGLLEWVAMPSSRGSSQPGIEHWSPALQADSLRLSH